MNELDRLFDLADEGDADAIYEIALRMLEGRGLNKDPQGAYDNFRDLQNAGYENAEVQIARMYYYGYFGAEMVNTGAQMLIDFSENGNPVACYELGYIYEKGISTATNMNNAIELYTNAAECGYEPAIAALKRLGYSVEKKYDDELLGFDDEFSGFDDDIFGAAQNVPDNSPRPKPASSKNDPNYIYAEGLKYLYGKGVPRDTTRGSQILSALASKGHRDANIALGRYYLSGGISESVFQKYTDANLKKYMETAVKMGEANLAINYFEKAASLGGNVNLDLAYAYLVRYFNTHGSFDIAAAFDQPKPQSEKRAALAQNITQAYNYLIKAYNEGNKAALTLRPLFAEIGAEAFSWLAIDELYGYMRFRAAGIESMELSHVQVEGCVDFLLKNRNFQICRDYCRHRREALRTLAESGDTVAQRTLGTLLKKGDFIGTDWRSAAYWLGKAANAGDAEAMKEYADFYFGFYGGTKNVNYALELLESAARSKKADCVCALANALCRGLGSQRDSYDLNRGIALYEEQARLGDPQAMYELAEMYRDPRTKHMKRRSAEQLYRQAADRGYKKAKRKLCENYGYPYTREELVRWFDDDMQKSVIHGNQCNCGSTMAQSTKRFLGKYYFQCAECGAKYSI